MSASISPPNMLAFRTPPALDLVDISPMCIDVIHYTIFPYSSHNSLQSHPLETTWSSGRHGVTWIPVPVLQPRLFNASLSVSLSEKKKNWSGHHIAS